MRTQPVMISSNEANILFDDRSLLETTLGKDALQIVSINANCDCSAHYSTESDDLVDSHPIPASAATLH